MGTGKWLVMGPLNKNDLPYIYGSGTGLFGTRCMDGL